MDNHLQVYVSILCDSLQKKLTLIKRLLELTREQAGVLAQEKPDMEVFNEKITQKEVLLKEIQELDEGFTSLFEKTGDELKEKKEQYQARILEMQNCIRAITDCGVELEGMEKRNKEKFQQYLLQERKEIRDSRRSSQTAVSYHQNMANQHREWQSYFMDQKK